MAIALQKSRSPRPRLKGLTQTGVDEFMIGRILTFGWELVFYVGPRGINANPFTKTTRNNNSSSLIKKLQKGKILEKEMPSLGNHPFSPTHFNTTHSIDPTKRSVAEDSGIATNNESANEKPSSRKRSAREIAQLYEQLKRK